VAKKYLLKLPGKPDKIVENIIFDTVQALAEKEGGTLEEFENLEKPDKVNLSRTATLSDDLGLR